MAYPFPVSAPMNLGGTSNLQGGGLQGFAPEVGFGALDRLGGGGQLGGVQDSMMAGLMQSEMKLQTMMVEMMMMLMTLMQGKSALSPSPSPVDSSSAGVTDVNNNGGSSAATYASGFGAAGANAVDASQFQGGTATGRTLAAAAENEANAEHSTGWCYRGVSRALQSIGVTATGEAAWMAADQLAKNPKMKEVKVDRSQLAHLPPGAVIVWNKGAGHPYGHISVCLGDGREASDHIQKQMSDLGGGESFRVFMPL